MIDGLYFEEHGPPGAPPVILSAGLGGSGAYWQPNLAALAASHRVILYDQRGTGRSDRRLPANHSIDHMAGDVVRLVEGLGLGRVHFVGHALGGAIGLVLAAEAPEVLRSLAVVNGWTRIDPHTSRCFELRLDLLRRGGARAYLRAQPLFLYPATWISGHLPEIDAELEGQIEAFQGEDNLESRIAALRAFQLDDERLGAILVPILALAAKDDLLVPWTATRDLADRVPSASTRWMEWGGHACNVTDPESFNSILLAWLAGAPFQGE